MATISAKIFEHHEKSDGTINVKYIVYHKGVRRYIDSPHFVSRRQFTKDFEIKDKRVLKWIDEQLDEYRIFISSISTRLQFLSCDQLRDILRDCDKDIDIIEVANDHIAFLKSEEQNRESYSYTFRKIRNSLGDSDGADHLVPDEADQRFCC